MPCCPEFGTALGGASILPDDRPADGRERFPIPEDERLALVGDSDGIDQPAGGTERVAGGRNGGVDQGVGVVLHLPGRWKVLGNFPVATADHLPVGSDHQCSGTGGALVEGEDGRHPIKLLSPGAPCRAHEGGNSAILQG